jgi:hypothetical protein
MLVVGPFERYREIMKSSLAPASHLMWRAHVKVLVVLFALVVGMTLLAAFSQDVAGVGFVYGFLLALFAAASTLVIAIALRFSSRRAVVLPIAYTLGPIAIYVWAIA